MSIALTVLRLRGEGDGVRVGQWEVRQPGVIGGRCSGGAARAAAPSAADGLRGLYYARLAERYCTKLDDNHCKQVFEYLKGAQ